tara:strand:- start:116 stop:256 length:141 start_codon:yes stop_codon:yes gene_type:complete
MIRIENRTGPGGSTPRLHQKEIVVVIEISGDSDEEPSSKKNISGDV